MGMKARIFLDTSALFAGIWSAEGGARMILKLGEVGAISLLVSSIVLIEIERVLRRKAPKSLGALTLLLDRSGFQVVDQPGLNRVNESLPLSAHIGDAQILAAAWDANADYFVTLDRKHFLNNGALREKVPYQIGTPGDFLAWYRGQFVN